MARAFSTTVENHNSLKCFGKCRDYLLIFQLCFPKYLRVYLKYSKKKNSSEISKSYRKGLCKLYEAPRKLIFYVYHLCTLVDKYITDKKITLRPLACIFLSVKYFVRAYFCPCSKYTKKKFRYLPQVYPEQPIINMYCF